MSRKSARNRPTPERATPDAVRARDASRSSRRSIVVGSVAALLLAIAAGAFLVQREGAQSAQPAAVASRAALASDHAPALGDENAKVHVVEFLDPACETCALFYPLVKQLLAENPGRIRLSIRHVAFHEGSDYVVRLLEASRKQDKYWQTLEALLASQAQWAPHHTVQPELAWQAIAGVGLNVAQAMADMNAADVAQRVAQDRNDAMTLKVTATPEYFVNGRPLPSFGDQQLLNLVREELQRAY
jgi:protein-disulfide isomerase